MFVYLVLPTVEFGQSREGPYVLLQFGSGLFTVILWVKVYEAEPAPGRQKLAKGHVLKPKDSETERTDKHICPVSGSISIQQKEENNTEQKRFRGSAGSPTFLLLQVLASGSVW